MGPMGRSTQTLAMHMRNVNTEPHVTLVTLETGYSQTRTYARGSREALAALIDVDIMIS